MKLIHCADLHLDSRMSANLDKEKAKERKGEILHTFERMVDYAAQNGVTAILIAGDMFDTRSISATVRNTVLYQIGGHPEITFYYLKGNHDSDNFLSDPEEIPDNVRLFGPAWTAYGEAGGKVVISGIELSAENAGSACVSLTLDAGKYNIVMLHGQESEGASKDRAAVINLKALRNKGIDYLALGHIHAYKREKLDARGIYCYPGCLEGRGFDECGAHGFVLLDVDEETGRCTQEFIPFAGRKLYTVEVDATDCRTTAEMSARMDQALREAGCSADGLVKIVLRGMLDVACEKDVQYLQANLRSRFYYGKVYDETTLRIDIEDYRYDESLKGEYVRQVMADDTLPDEDKKLIIRYGLQALAGEEVQ